MARLRVVLDTNVLVSGLAAQGAQLESCEPPELVDRERNQLIGCL
jgi:predicted nucleic acid-binding protein